MDAFDLDEWDGYGDPDRDDGYKGEKACKFCRAGPLEWQEARTNPGNRKKWVLIDPHGAIHDCRRAAAPSDFPLVQA